MKPGADEDHVGSAKSLGAGGVLRLQVTLTRSTDPGMFDALAELDGWKRGERVRALLSLGHAMQHMRDVATRAPSPRKGSAVHRQTPKPAKTDHAKDAIAVGTPTSQVEAEDAHGQMSFDTDAFIGANEF